MLTGWTVAGRDATRRRPGPSSSTRRLHEEGAAPLMAASIANRRCAGRGRARRSRPRARDRPTHRREIRPRLRRRFPSAGAGREIGANLRRDRTATSARWRARCSPTRTPGAAPPTKLRDPWQMMIAAYRALALDRASRTGSFMLCRCSGCRCGRRAVQTVFPTTPTPGRRPKGSRRGSRSPRGLAAWRRTRRRRANLVDRVLPDAPIRRASGAARRVAAAGAGADAALARIPEEVNMASRISLDRRQWLGGAGAVFAAANLPRWASAAGARDPRLVSIILRGALDGLSAVGPLGDPDYAGLHGELALEPRRRACGAAARRLLRPQPGDDDLRPALRREAGARRSRRGDQLSRALAFRRSGRARERHAGAGPHAERLAQPGGRASCPWRSAPRAARLAVGFVPPLVLRGAAPVLGWAPAGPAGAERRSRRAGSAALYEQGDPALAPALRAGSRPSGKAGGMAGMKAGGDVVAQMRQGGAGAARLMAADDGPRIAALAFDGWDTHVAEGGATGRLRILLGGLDDAFGGFETALGPALGATRSIVVDHRVRPHRARQRRRRLRPRHRVGGVSRRRRGAGGRVSPIGRA